MNIYHGWLKPSALHTSEINSTIWLSKFTTCAAFESYFLIVLLMDVFIMTKEEHGVTTVNTMNKIVHTFDLSMHRI